MASNRAAARLTEDQIDELLDNPESLTRLRILRNTRKLLAARGLSVTMDDLSEAAGVGRRTLFRHFATREQLMADALSSVLDWYEQEVTQVQEESADLDTWLSKSVLRMLEIHKEAGLALWQLAVAQDDELSPQMARINQRRRNNRKTMTASVAANAWRRVGGQGECPAHVVDAFALTFSTFATHSLLDDFGSSDESFIQCSTMMLSLVLSAAAKGSKT